MLLLVDPAAPPGASVVVVGVKMDSHSRELLTWALVKVAQPGDSVIALHVLDSAAVPEGKSTLLSLVKSFDSVLSAYEGFCNLKQVELKLKVCRGSPVRKVIRREVDSYEEASLILGTSKTHHRIRSSASVAKYCARKLSSRFTVLAVNNGKVIFQRLATFPNKGQSPDKYGDKNCAAFVEVTNETKAVGLASNFIDSHRCLQKSDSGCNDKTERDCVERAPSSLERNDSGIDLVDELPEDNDVGNSLALVPFHKPRENLKSNSIVCRESSHWKSSWPLLRRIFLSKHQAEVNETPDFLDLTSPTLWFRFRVSFLLLLLLQFLCKIMAEVMNMAAADESLDRRRDRQDKSSDEQPHSSPPSHPPAAPPPPSRRRDRDERDRRDDRDFDRPPNRRGDNYDRNRSPPSLPPRDRDRDRDRDYKRRSSLSPPPPYRDRRHSPPRRSPPPPYKRSRRDDGGYDGRKGSPRGGFGPGDRRFGYDYGGGYEREMRGRPGYVDDRPLGRYIGRSSGGYQDWDSNRGGHGDALNAGGGQREGLMTYKQFMQELEDDILPAEAERRYQEYKSEYITTQKQAFFDSHKDEEWLRDKYHPTNLVTVIERRNELAQRTAKDFLLDLQSGTLDLGPGISAAATNKSGQASEPNSDDEADNDGKRRRHGRGPAKEMDLLSAAPKAHPVSSEPRRIQIDIGQAQALVRKLDSEKGIEENILSGSDSDKLGRDKAHGGSSGPVIIIRGLTTVKGLEGVELLDTLLTYLWRIHGLDYYGMVETREAKGLRHVREEGKNSNMASGADEWEKKLDLRWQERLRGQDLLEVMTAKDKIEAAALEAFDPYVRKIRDEKYGWKYGCGAKGCTKLFHAPEFVHKHLNLKHPELVMELTSKVREELYFQNYMNDADAPGGTPVMQQSLPKDKPQRRRMNLDGRLKDDRGNRRDRDNWANGGDRFDRSENPQSSDFPSANDGTDGGNIDDPMFDSFGGQGRHVAPFASEIPPPVLMPVPGAGPLGPFVPAPPEVAMRMLREQGGPPPFEGGGRNGRPGPQLGGSAPILALSSGFRQDPRRIRSYQDLDAPEDEVTVIDYRSL